MHTNIMISIVTRVFAFKGILPSHEDYRSTLPSIRIICKIITYPKHPKIIWIPLLKIINYSASLHYRTDQCP